MFKSLFNKLFKKADKEVDSLSQTVVVSNTKTGLRIKVDTDCTHVNVYVDAAGIILTPNNYNGYKICKGWIHIGKKLHPELPTVNNLTIKTYNHEKGECFFWSQL